jgi:hypothetical protein
MRYTAQVFFNGRNTFNVDFEYLRAWFWIRKTLMRAFPNSSAIFYKDNKLDERRYPEDF